MGMKHITQQETRPETIFRHTRAMLHEQRVSMGTFAMAVIDAYHDAVHVSARSIAFKTDGDLFRCAQTNAQKLSRYMEPDISARLPAEIEEAWVQSLQEPYRSQCRADLARRYGLMAVRLPDHAASACVHSLSAMSMEFGRTLEAVAPTLADGRIDAADAPHIPAALRELDALIAGALSLRAELAGLAKLVEESGDA